MRVLEKELLESGHSPESVSKYLDMLKNVTKDSAGVRALGQMLSEVMPADVSEGLAHIMDTVTEVAEADFGPGVATPLWSEACHIIQELFSRSPGRLWRLRGRRRRYDKMIGKFTGMDTPACGFSIGFERIVTILLDNGFKVPAAAGKKAYLFEKNIGAEKLAQVLKEASEERKAGVQVLVADEQE